MTTDVLEEPGATTALPAPGPAAPRVTPSGKPGKAEPSLLVDRVFEELRGRLARGEWSPGEHLRIREMAALVGTSEMPVREAFRRLAQAGLLTLSAYRGATVRVLGMDELEALYDVRLILEPEAGRLGALRADPSVVAVMQHHWARIQTAATRGDVAELVTEDEWFLGALYRAGRNDVLVDLVNGMWNTCRPYKNLWVAATVDRLPDTWLHVPRLLTAVAANDGDAAFDILHHTYQHARAVVRQLIDEQAGTEQ